MTQLHSIQAPLDSQQIAHYLGDALHQLRHFEVFGEIDSTNDWALQQCIDNRPLPVACCAEAQRHGRGRRGRFWASPRSSNIYLSLAWPFRRPLAELGSLALVAGISVARTLSAYGVLAKLKWPNDVLVEGGKIAGVLIESRIRPGRDSEMIIGVGLNVAMPVAEGRLIDQRWTDLLSVYSGEQGLERNRLVAELLYHMMDHCRIFDEQGFAAFRSEWDRLDLCRGRVVEVRQDDKCWIGEARGIDDQGALVVQTEQGERAFNAAEVNLRI
jgi:BirA family biotin operon repressor/biotin-[acetyl-CoA-carboxylase] ligase